MEWRDEVLKSESVKRLINPVAECKETRGIPGLPGGGRVDAWKGRAVARPAWQHNWPSRSCGGAGGGVTPAVEEDLHNRPASQGQMLCAMWRTHLHLIYPVRHQPCGQ